MPVIVFISSLVTGLVVVGALLLLQSVMAGSHPGWTLPFSAWWGMILALPGLLMSFTRMFRG